MKKYILIIFLCSLSNLSFAVFEEKNDFCLMIKSYFLKYPFSHRIHCNFQEEKKTQDRSSKTKDKPCPEEWYLAWVGLNPEHFGCKNSKK